MINGLLQDLRFAIRQLRKNLGFAFIAVATLALGIGANTAIFSLLNAVMLRNLPVPQPQQLMLFGEAKWAGSMDSLPDRSWQLFSYQLFSELRQKNQAFSDVAAVSSILFTTHGRVAGGDKLEKVDAELVSGSYFNTLGVNAIVGRVLTDADDQVAGGHPVAVASYSWWQQRFGKNPSAVGKTVTIGSTVYSIIGIAAPEFFGVTVGQSPDVWIPLAMEKQISPGWNGLDDKLFQSLYLIGRRKSGVSVEQAGANTNLLFKQIVQEYAGPQPNPQQLEAIKHAQIDLTPASTGLSRLRQQFSAPLKILMAVVGLVLLVACANVANLLLARATARRREIAVRMSMGASRFRLIRQLFAESALLATAGALLGIWFAWWSTRLLLIMVSTGSTTLPLRVTPDAQVLGFTLVVAVLTVILFGTAPSFYATRLDLVPSLKEGRGTTPGRSRGPLARGLIVGQVALSLVLLVGAGLFLRSLVNLTNVDTGFNKQNVAMTSFDVVGTGYQQDARLEAFMERTEANVDSIPGIRAASFAFFVFNGGGWTTGITIPGRLGSDSDPDIAENVVGPQYFDVMGMPLVLGRPLTAQDSATSHKVAVINETMARTYFGGESPLGRTFTLGTGAEAEQQKPEWRDLEVVGVVKDAKYMGLQEKQMPAAFYPHSQHPMFLYQFIARYTGDASTVAPAIARAVRELDPNLPVGDFTTLSHVVDDSVLDHRLVAQLCSFFGGVAALLACIGIYGLISYGVSRRTSEFGLRMALGAGRQNVVWLVLREALTLVLIGVGIGLAASPLINQLATSFLFGLKPYDPLTIGLAIIAMTGVALFAGYIPARRAAKVDPMVALRYE